MPAATPKSLETRQRVLNAALKLFSSNGYRGTTMRAIAVESGLSLGNAYYHFESKDELARELLRSLAEQQRALAWPRLQVGNNLETNIRTVMDVTLEVLEPFHDFGPAFIRGAFAGGQAPAGASGQRAREFALWRQAVATARPQPPLSIRQDLPELLWLVQRGLLLFWSYDQSPGRARTRRLIRSAAPLLARLAVLSRLPVVRSIVDDLIGLVRSTQLADSLHLKEPTEANTPANGLRNAG